MPEPNQSGATLIAAWPGMGSVAIIAAGYLVRKLNMQEVGQLPSDGFFDIAEVTVKSGLVEPAHFPRGHFFRWGNPGGSNLIVFLAEAQPTANTYGYARALISAAEGMGASRIITFASMASAIHPSADPKVSGITTDAASLEDLRRAEVKPLEDGQIGGLNGVALAAAAERGMSGVCLLAEIPYFAAAAPNPKAARAALSVFSVLAGIDISLDELNQHAASVERLLVDAYDRLQAAGAFEADESTEQEPGEAERAPPPTSERAGGAPAADTDKPGLDAAARKRIEGLFKAARQDQSRAGALKQELDRLGVFKQYENRFLDLFRRAG